MHAKDNACVTQAFRNWARFTVENQDALEASGRQSRPVRSRWRLKWM